MLVSVERNGVARVPSRAKLVATVTPWQRTKQPTLVSESLCEPIVPSESLCKQIADPPDDPLPMLVDWFERTTSADGSLDWKWFPLFPNPEPPIPTCYCCGKRNWWRSATGGQTTCAVCHPPVSPRVVAEWIGEQVAVT